MPTAADAYKKIKELRLTGTPEQVVATFNSYGLTVKPIKIDELLQLLNFLVMLQRRDRDDGGEKWAGSLPNMRRAVEAMTVRVDDETPQQQQQREIAGVLLQAYRTWFSHVTNPRQVHWDTTIPDYARPFVVFRQWFAGTEVPGIGP